MFAGQVASLTQGCRTGMVELINAVTHGFGLVLSLAGAPWMIHRAATHGNLWQTIGSAIFVGALIAVYTASTLSHAVIRPPWRYRFRVLDQGFIYLLIAASYTPWAIAYLHTTWCWIVFAGIWMIALNGFVSKLVYRFRISRAGVISYIVLGWMPLLVLPAVLVEVPPQGSLAMLAGGVFYTLGTVFLVVDHQHLYFHGIWHLMVVSGSAIHYFAVYFYAIGS